MVILHSVIVYSAGTLAEVDEESSTYIVINIIPINGMYCGGASAVTYTTTVSPPHGLVDINQNIHNITGLVENTTYTITTVALRGGNMVHNATIIASTLESESKYIPIINYDILIVWVMYVFQDMIL